MSEDAEVLDQLNRAGSDLSRPHSLEFFLYFPNQASAQEAMVRLQARGYQAKTEQAAVGHNWLCLARKQMVPELATIRSISEELDRLARSLGGEYDGWGAPVVR